MSRSFLVAVLLALLGGSSAFAYTVVLKDGTTMVAQEKYEVHGDQALITLLNGSQTVIDAKEIDTGKTEEANSGPVLGDAVVLTDRGVERLRAATADPERQRTLQDLIQERQAAKRNAKESTRASDLQVRSTAGGHPDFTSLRRLPLDSDAMTASLGELLVAGGIDRFRVYRGTQPSHVFIELVAGNDDEVFAALESLAQITMDVRQRYPEIEGLEVLMTSTSRSRAGQFLLTPQNAPLLVNHRMTPADFFLEYVQY
jgi:hypothetical protein